MQGYKTDFPLLMQDKTVYIDNAATAQRPKCVIDAEKDFYTCHNANPLRGIYELSVQATENYENARKAVRDFIGAKSVQEIIFTRNTTESINLVAYSYGLSNLKKGDEVVVSIMEHHSDLLPWQMVCRQTGAELKFLECEKDGSLDLNKAEELITDRTKIVAVTQLSNAWQRISYRKACRNCTPQERCYGGRRCTEHAAYCGGREKAWGGFLCIFRSQALWTYGHRRALRQA